MTERTCRFLGFGLVLLALWVPGGVTLSQANLLLNPGFEEWTGGLPDCWRKDDSLRVSQAGDTVYAGVYSAKVTLLTQAQDLADFWADTVMVNPGREHTLCFWVLDHDSSGRARPFIWWYGSDGSHLSSHWSGTYSSDTTAWQWLVTTDTAPSEAAKAVVGLRFYDIASRWRGEAAFWVDDAYFGEGVGMTKRGKEESASSTLHLSVFPNPARSPFRVEFTVPDPSVADLVVYDRIGRKVATLLESNRRSGRDAISWDPPAGNIPPGYYFLKLEASGQSMVEKVGVIR